MRGNEHRSPLLLALAAGIAFAVLAGIYTYRLRSDHPVPLSNASGVSRLADLELAVRARERIDINTATVEQLMRLNGIGPVLAERIIAYRREHGMFRSIVDITAVKGIKGKRLAAIGPFVYVSCPDDGAKGPGHGE